MKLFTKVKHNLTLVAVGILCICLSITSFTLFGTLKKTIAAYDDPAVLFNTNGTVNERWAREIGRAHV
jgi:hypothetical protein